MTNNYRKMWEDIAYTTASRYSRYKFVPTYRIGLTNYLRERAIINYLAPKKTDTVLDVGCAAGRQLFEISTKIKEGHGTDIAENFIDEANKNKKEKGIMNLSFQQSRIESLPFSDHLFSKIICAEVLEHVFNENVALMELKRVLAPEGILVVSVPNLNADATLWGRLLRFLGFRNFIPIEVFTDKEVAKHGDAHVREFSKKSLKKWLNDNGFDIEAISSVSFIDGPSFDFLLKFPLHVAVARKIIIRVELLLSRTGFPLGRHLVVRARKKKNNE